MSREAASSADRISVTAQIRAACRVDGLAPASIRPHAVTDWSPLPESVMSRVGSRAIRIALPGEVSWFEEAWLMAAPAPATSELRRRGDLDVLTWPAFDAFDVDVMVTTRHGGVSSGSYGSLNLGLHVGDEDADVLENRRRAASALGADPGDFVFCVQAHGPNVQIVTAADRGRGTLTQQDAVPGTDALVTADPGVALTVMVADCVPIVLYDPRAHVLACVHAGWRGTVARVSEAAVAAMGTLGGKPENVIAGLGPAIPPDRYQVGEDVREAAAEGLGDRAAQVIRPDGTGRWLFDLWTANRLVLRDAGVPEDHMHLAQIPTGSDPGLFFSDRAVRPCGRFAAMARLRPRGPRDTR
jgi:purine-nucleoside/S-methyl-5'-thioadenosine phosphorylase / adenosine deaminase